MEMTTNGWWLRSWKDTCRFAGIVGESAARERLSIRISNSIWHDAFRKGEKHIISRRALQEALENPCEWFDLPEPLCECGGALVCEENSHRCDGCGERMSEEEYYDTKDAALMRPGHHAIPLLIEGIKSGNVGVDAKWTEPERLSPAGRALKNGMGQQDGLCHPASELKFTINPDGSIRDVCCYGGRAPLGHIRGGALRLFALRYELLKAVHEQFPRPKSGCTGIATVAIAAEDAPDSPAGGFVARSPNSNRCSENLRGRSSQPLNWLHEKAPEKGCQPKPAPLVSAEKLPRAMGCLRRE